MKVLIAGVIYPGIERFLNEYFDSLKNQTYTDFEVLLIEDGLSLPKNYFLSNVIINSSKKESTSAEIRFYIINFAKENNYDILIFTDCDDYFCNSRVERAISTLENVDFYINKLCLVTEISDLIHGNISLIPPLRISKTEILHSNYFGLSNSAIKLNILPNNFYIPSELVAVDWWIFTMLIWNNKQYVYDENVVTYYRQHGNNIAGYGKNLTEEKLFKGIDIKLLHYKRLAEYSLNNNFFEYVPVINQLIDSFIELKMMLKNKEFIDKYIYVINKHYTSIGKGWWSDILSLEQWRLYA